MKFLFESVIKALEQSWKDISKLLRAIICKEVYCTGQMVELTNLVKGWLRLRYMGEFWGSPVLKELDACEQMFSLLC